MKSIAVASAATLFAGSAIAGALHHHGHANHELFHLRRGVADSDACACTTYTTTWYGEAKLYTPTEVSTVSVEPTAASVASTTTTSSSTTWTSSTSSTTSTTATTSSTTLTTSSTTSSSSTSTTSSSSAYVAPTSATSKVVQQAQVAPQSGLAASSPSSSEAQSTTSPASSTPSFSTSGSSAPIGGGDKWCMAYSPYSNDHNCKSAGDIESDVVDIASRGFQSVRLYATDCGGLQAVGNAAKQHNLKIVAGIWIDDTGLGNAGEQVNDLIQWGQWDLVEMVVVGNEAVFNNFIDAGSLASFISSCKQKFKSAGFSGKTTTTEPLNTLQKFSSTLCPVMDVASANLHPFFNQDTTAEAAGQFVEDQLKVLENTCPGKDAYNLETGWPTQGEDNQSAKPGVENQRTAVEGIVAHAGGKSALLSYVNDMWKPPGAFNAEQFWGCKDLFSN